MKKYILSSFFFCLLQFHSRGTPFTILFSDGTQVKVQRVEIVSEIFDAWKKNDNSLKEMFYKYNFPSSLNEYKQVFYQNKYPEGIDKIYDEWRSKMDGISITPQCIFYGMLDQMEIACIQYYFTEGTVSVQMSHLSKRVDGKWYPIGSALMPKYQHVMALFGTLQPELAACMINADPVSRYNEAALELISSCMAGTSRITEACIYQMAETWGMSADEHQLQKERNLFRNRMTEDVPESKRKVIEQDLLSYVHSLGLPPEATKRVMYYFSKNESMKAVSVMRANGLAIDNKTLFADLNRVQQTTQYRTIENKVQETPKEN